LSLPPLYSPHEIEARLYEEWERSGQFQPDPTAGRPFTIVIPPPNVTGILHMGHALNNTLQDILIRFRRMQGYAALWVPGTDHAGIATQNVVERELAKAGLDRHQLGREEFLKRVWQWRDRYGSTIVRQLRRLGASCDWSRERFTMDEGLSRAVRTAFHRLYEAGLIHRGRRMVNWCPRCQTALADEEVTHELVEGHLWYIRYPIVDADGWVVVATTRPETMLGDVAVAVHPEDPRYRHWVGVRLRLPLVDREIPVIADGAVDPHFATGAVKVTPAHDPVDFEMAQRHGLEPLVVILPDGRMTRVPDRYEGLDRFECRKRIVEELASCQLLERSEPYEHAIGHCYRCKTVIEPYVSYQWFVRMEPLARLGIEAVERDGLRFFPERWTKVYLDWLRNIRDWCISRQIWWGHRIPVWYCPSESCDGKRIRCWLGPELGGFKNLPTGAPPSTHADGIPLAELYRTDLAALARIQFYVAEPSVRPMVGVEPPSRCPRCGRGDLWQDPDVLDTWFSSWLWPFSTLGWPESTEDLARYYPTSVLVTGQDILFFWVARMVMAGKFFLKQIPFQDVYIHGIIRVEGGKKMSKSLGNIIDPLNIIDTMGADALRFSLAHMTSSGQDLYLSPEKFLMGRNFANKLWNAARLILEGGLAPSDHKVGWRALSLDPHGLTLFDRWMLSRLQRVIQSTTEALEAYRFNEVARSLHRFVWHEMCDWYLEVIKLQRAANAQPTQVILLHLLDQVLRLLHPLMPFITEAIWRLLPSDEHHKGFLLKAAWPSADPRWDDPDAEAKVERLQWVVSEVRNIRSTFRVPVQQKVTVHLAAEDGLDLVAAHEPLIMRLAGVERLMLTDRFKRPEGAATSHWGGWDLAVPLAGLVDLAKERSRIEKEIRTLEERCQSKRNRLNDPNFRSKAPAEVVSEEEESLRRLEEEISRWRRSLSQLA